MSLPSAKTGTLTAAGPSATTFESSGGFNVSLWGTWNATVVLERSFEGGPWLPFTYIDGSPLAWTGPMSTTMDTPGATRWRLNATSFSSGTINWRLSS